MLLILEKVGDIYLRFNNTELEFDGNNENQTGIVDKNLIEKFKNLNFESLQDLQDENPETKFSVDKTKVEENNNLCSICYEDLIDLNGANGNEAKKSDEEIVKCPDCKNIFHEDCVKKWLNIGNSTCVYCRSHVWRDFNNNLEGEQNYINLS